MSTKKQKKAAMPKGKKVHKNIGFPLSKEKYDLLADSVKALDGEIADLAQKFEEVKNSWKDKIKERTVKRNEQMATMISKKEILNVECVLEQDFNAKEVRFWYDGEVVDARTMTADEFQTEMDFQKRKADGDKAVTGEGRGARARAVRQKLQNDATIENDPVASAHAATEAKANGKFADIADVHHMETKRGTKTSAVDGPTRQ